ncbi:MAG: fibronectin/fibrinogen-binding protein [Clostridiaceae bacterium]|nr:fibronectin/fibrinogen-binding protein [Clostridiaceae bacterium]
MPFDGILANNIVKEFNNLLAGGRINKIYQINNDSVVFSIRSKGENFALFASCKAQAARIHLTDKQFENPLNPPIFCILLRKHLMGGRIKGFFTEGFERIITMEVEAVDELGDRDIKKLVFEIMGKHSNIVLLNKDDKIIDAIKHIDFAVNRVREILPARVYVFPPAQNKLNPENSDTFDIILNEAIGSERKISSFLLDKLQGFSPALCREICVRAKVDEDKPASLLSHVELTQIIREIKLLLEELNTKGPIPSIAFDFDRKKVIDFHCTGLSQYGPNKHYDRISDAIDTFYTLKDSWISNNQQAQNLLKLVEKLLGKSTKRLAINIETYEVNKDYDNFRLYGELITANIHSLKKGMDKATLVNYYSETGDMVEIPLDINKSPQQNAQSYYKKYSKAKTAYSYAEKQIEIIKTEISYLESIIFAIETAQNPEQLNEIRLELYEQGYLNQPHNKKARNKTSKIKTVPISPLKLNSGDGFEIMIGRNNKENDKLTFKVARNEDIWLHIKNFPGSHVVIKTEGKSVPDSTLLEAAQYTAWFSKARSSSKVEVDYTFVRHVKKPSGAKPGMVIYTNYNTILVEPKEPVESK